ncbi:MAG: hypothetical protein ABID35_03220 [Candidatus Margulisiibacteriota bacterium]
MFSLKQEIKQATFALFTLSFVIALALPSRAALTSDNYMIPDLVVPAGGATEMTSDNYILQDSKGFYGGEFSNGHVIQLGPIYVLGTGEVGEGPPVIEVPPGTVLLNIERDRDDIKISWDPQQYPNPQIFILDGIGTGQFTNNFVGQRQDSNWVPRVDQRIENEFDLRNLADGILIHSNKVGRLPNEIYYKGLENNITPDRIAEVLPTALAVGKVNIEIDHHYNLISTPLQPINSSLDSFIGSQLAEGDQIQSYDGNTYIPATFTNGTWGNPFRINLAEGYWIYRNGERTIITLAGRVLNENSTHQIATHYNLIGNPFPVLRTNLGVAGFSPVEGDQVYSFKEGDYRTSNFVDDAWDQTISLSSGNGYWYFRNSNGIDWVLSSP